MQHFFERNCFFYEHGAVNEPLKLKLIQPKYCWAVLKSKFNTTDKRKAHLYKDSLVLFCKPLSIATTTTKSLHQITRQEKAQIQRNCNYIFIYQVALTRRQRINFFRFSSHAATCPFIPSAARIMAPLNRALTGKNQLLEWTEMPSQRQRKL